MTRDDRDVLPEEVKPLHYDLSLHDIDPKAFTYSGTVTIDLAIKTETSSIVLNAKNLEVQSAEASGQKVSGFDFDKRRERSTITFPAPLPISDGVKLKISFTGVLNNTLAGFYRSEYKVPGGNEPTHMFSTHFESCDARQAFPCFDEPNLKATFDVSLTVPTTWTAISNMPVKSEEPNSNNLKVVHFERTPKMSTYLVAWACGEFEYLETFTKRSYNGRPIPVRVYTTKLLKNQAQFALENAAKIVDYYSEVFDIDYMLPKLDMLAVHEFPIGAMENWGLLTYRSSALLYNEGKTDPRSLNRIAYIVAHELAHQWFGNLVTMDWWNELWLKEGFATWVGWFATDHFYPDWDVWSQFVAESMQSGFRLDSLRSSHPIDVPVRDALEVDQIFDHISYLKGSSIIRMLSEALGTDTFLKGVSNYLKKHTYANSRTEDLWAALSEQSGRDINAIMDDWIHAMGFPVLKVTEDSDSLTIRQTRYLSTGEVKAEDDRTIWWVPLGLSSDALAAVGKAVGTALEVRETTIGKLSTEHYKLNVGQHGFYRVNYPVERFAKLGATMKNFSVSDRIGLISDAQALALSGDGTTTSLLGLLEGMKGEDSYLVWEAASTAFFNLRVVFGSNPEIKEGLKKLAGSLYSPAAEKLGWECSDGEDYLTTRLRGLLIGGAAGAGHEGIINEAKSQFQKHLSGGDIHASLRLPVYRIAVGNGSREEYDQIWKEYINSTSLDIKEITLESLGSATEETLINDYLEKLVSGTISTQNFHWVAGALAGNSHARPLLWKFIKERWDDIFKILSGNMTLLDRLIRVGLSRFADEAILEDMTKFFESKEDQRGYDRAVKFVLDIVSGNVRWLKRDEKVVAEWLKAKGY